MLSFPPITFDDMMLLIAMGIPLMMALPYTPDFIMFLYRRLRRTAP